jgi:hypothetical protein
MIKVYKLYCAELRYTCYYDNVKEMSDDIVVMMENDGVGLVFTIEIVQMSQKKYDSLPESDGW